MPKPTLRGRKPANRELQPELYLNRPKARGFVSIRRRPQAEQSPAEQSRVFLVELDKLDEVFNSEVGKRHDAVISDAIDPDDAVLGIHFVGHVPQPVFVFAEVLSDTSDGGDMMNLVDVHGHAA